MTKVLVTGANGFVGRAVLNKLLEQDYEPIAAIRNIKALPDNVSKFRINDLDGNTDWTNAFVGVNCVIHCAARVHVMNDKTSDPLEEFRKTNVAGTLNLARQAAAAGVRRFIFISSIKVNGERTELNKPYREEDIPVPVDPYGISKMETELALRTLAIETGIEIVIIRPPLIYGPGVRANFMSMMSFLRTGIPLPLGAIHNKRTLVGIDNLTDLIMICVSHPAAANQTFLAGDAEDVSTTELLRKTGKALESPARLLPLPEWFIKFGAKLIGKANVAQRLCGNLQVDISKARILLGWEPSVSIDEGLRHTAEAYRGIHNSTY
ncbi:MAG: NAD-dependent epimerase/dehydratase family protein [Aquirhabdus sp.]